jgi:hypothetical protein
MTLMILSQMLAGCTPNDAEVTADYAIFLAAASSENLNRLARTGTDVEESAGKLGLVPFDCRDLSALETEEEIVAARLGGVDFEAECCVDGAGAGEDCERVAPKWFGWVDDYAYYLKEGKVETWRTEAVLTSEGDLQLTMHMDFPQFGDFRFGWVIDPDFQPTECRDGENGAEESDIDGNWLEGWSAQEEKGTLYHLNANAFQINPSNNAVAWYFEQEWMAGYTFARFADEEFYGHAVDYSDEAYRPFYMSSDVGSDDGQEGTSIPKPRIDYPGWVSNVTEYFDSEVTDLQDIGKSAFPLSMKIEDNAWRTEDGVAAGLDGWLGVSPSWVRIDNPEDIAAGTKTPITGEFQIYLEGVAAASKVMVHGTFSIDNVREDVWGYHGPDGATTFEEVKETENNTPTCGEERLTTDE